MSTQQIYNNEKYITQHEFIIVTNELRNQIELLKNEIKNKAVPSNVRNTFNPISIETCGGTNPVVQAFLNLKKKIAVKLDIPNGPKVGKVAGAVQREIKEKNEGMDAIQVSNKAYELFEANIEKYRGLAK